MLNYYQTAAGRMLRLDGAEPGCWISLVGPTEDELARVIADTGVEDEFLRAALDEEEPLRLEVDEGQTLLIADIPVTESEETDKRMFSTLPMGIIVTRDNVITVSLKENPVIADLSEGRMRNVNTALKTRFVLQMLLRAANRYLFDLRQIEKTSSAVERELYKSLKNKELIQLLTLEKSLVYFTTSLKSTETTLEKLLRGRILKLYEEDQELLEDVLVEFKQAIEMADIYSSILSGTMDAFASVISNNLNIIMKVLTIITILMTVPNIVFSFYGMNTDLPFLAHLAQWGIPSYVIPIGLAVLCTFFSWLFMKKRKLY
ncbi:MAG: magnesium transporter CorA family protein [Clostridia bacterium]|nr:magnesium transporter CorA family protein [Clostridia bacterium]